MHPESDEDTRKDDAPSQEGGGTVFSFTPSGESSQGKEAEPRLTFEDLDPDASTLPETGRQEIMTLWRFDAPDPVASSQADPKVTVRPDVPTVHGEASDGKEHPSHGRLARPRLDPTTLHDKGGENLETLGGVPEEPGYHLLEKIGEGGMGVIWRGLQGSLLRDVAIKQIKPGGGAEGQFVSEALVTGHLDHPNIVPVHALGQDGEGQLFLSMKLVSGLSWQDLLHPTKEEHLARAEGLGLEDQLRFLLSVCNAVAFAHSRHILHRDLKPENVMIGEFGEVLVMDWGIAVTFEPEPVPPHRARHSTGVDSPAGTPSYMAPEMASARGKALGPWTDVYLLGAMLHEILTGYPPHRGQNIVDVLMAAERSQPPAFNEDVHEELALICRKALARDPGDRFPDVPSFQRSLEDYLRHRQSLQISEGAERDFNALQAVGSEAGDHRRYGRFADVLSRFRQGLELWDGNTQAREGIRLAAHAYAEAALTAGDLGLASAQAEDLTADDPQAADLRTRIDQAVVQASRRERAYGRVRRALAAAAVVIIAGLAVGTLLVRNEQKIAEQERDRAKEAEQDAVAARDEEEVQRRRAEDAQGQAETNLELVKEELYASRILQALVAVKNNRLPQARSLLDRCDPARRGFEWGHVRRLSDQAVHIFHGHVKDVSSVAVHPGGARMVTASWDGLAKIWDIPTGKVLRVLRGHSGAVLDVAYSPDGRLIATAGRDGTVRLWNGESGAEQRSIPSPKGSVYALSFHPGGAQILGRANRGRLYLWDLRTGKTIRMFHGGTRQVLAFSFRPDGHHLAASLGPKDTLGIWISATGKVDLSFPAHGDGILAMGYSLSGRHLFTGGKNGKLAAWEAATGKSLWSVDAHDRVHCLDAARESAWIATGGRDGNLRLWEALTGAEGPRFLGHTGAVNDVAFVPGSRQLVTVSNDHTARLWDMDNRTAVQPMSDFTRIPPLHAFSPRGDAVVYCTYADFRFRALRFAGDELLSSLPRHPGRIQHLAFSGDGSRLASICTAGRMRLWNGATFEPVSEFDAAVRSASDLILDHSGSVAAVRIWRKGVWAWDTVQGKEILSLPDSALQTHSIALSPDGSLLAQGRSNGTVMIIRLPSGDRMETLGLSKVPVTALAFSPDSLCLSAGNRSGRVWIKDVGKNSASPLVRASKTAIFSLAYHPDGRRLLCLDMNGALTLLHSKTGSQLLSLLPGGREGAVFVDQGRTVAAFHPSGCLFYRTFPWRPVPDSLDALMAGLPALSLDRLEAHLEKAPDLAREMDDQGRTLLHKAVQANLPNHAALLLTRDAPPGTADHLGVTPLHLAGSAPSSQLTSLLLDKGADSNLLDQNGRSPLSMALSAGREDTALLLLARGADPRSGSRKGNGPLHKAVEMGSLALVQAMVKAGSDVNARGMSKSTALIIAAEEGHREIVSFLLDQKADPNLVSERIGGAALHGAVRGGHREVVILLLERGADVNLSAVDSLALGQAAQTGSLELARLLLDKGALPTPKGPSYSSPLHRAAEKGDTAMMGLLLERGADVKFQADYLRSPIFSAASGGWPQAVKMLLAAGADINARDEEQRTPLHGAAYRGDDAMAAFLLEQDASVNLVDEEGETPLLVTARRNHLDTARVLCTAKAHMGARSRKGLDALAHAMANINPSMVKLLLSHKASPATSLPKTAYTPLHSAAYNPRWPEKDAIEVSRSLLDAGADINARGRHGWTPLLLAIFRQKRTLIRRLIDWKANVNLASNGGLSPLIVAVDKNLDDVVPLLIKAGAKSEYSKDGSVTALTIACRNGHRPLAAMLLSHGADPNQLNRHLRGALFVAVKSRRRDLVSLLLSKGARINQRDVSGMTVLHNAALAGDTAMVQLLFKAGADLFVKDSRGWTPLRTAREVKKTETVKVLEALEEKRKKEKKGD